jgi:hypothetical protein
MPSSKDDDYDKIVMIIIIIIVLQFPECPPSVALLYVDLNSILQGLRLFSAGSCEGPNGL